MPPRTYQRPVSPYERMWIAAHQACPHLVIEGQGTIDPVAFTRAVQQAAEKNPGSRLVLRGFGPWLSWRDSGGPPPVRVESGAEWDGRSPQGASFLHDERIDLRHGPTCNFTLVPGPVPRVVFRAHHGVMDGMGMSWFLREVMRALRNEDPLGHPSTDTDLALARALGGRAQPQQTNCGRLIEGASENVLGVAWSRMTVDHAVKNPLARVLAFIARVAGRDGQDVLIDVPADLRRDFPEVRSTGNLTGSLRLSLRAGATPDEIASQIRTLTQGRRQADALVSTAYIRFLPIPIVRFFANRLRKRSVRTGAYTPTAVIANLGRFEMEHFSGGDFRATSVFGIPPAFEGTPLMITMSGGPDRVEMSARAPVALASKGRLDALLHAIANELE